MKKIIEIAKKVSQMSDEEMECRIEILKYALDTGLADFEETMEAHFIAMKISDKQP